MVWSVVTVQSGLGDVAEQADVEFGRDLDGAEPPRSPPGPLGLRPGQDGDPGFEPPSGAAQRHTLNLGRQWVPLDLREPG
jgi:hypothetical protein